MSANLLIAACSKYYLLIFNFPSLRDTEELNQMHQLGYKVEKYYKNGRLWYFTQNYLR